MQKLQTALSKHKNTNRAKLKSICLIKGKLQKKMINKHTQGETSMIKKFLPKNWEQLPVCVVIFMGMLFYIIFGGSIILWWERHYSAVKKLVIDFNNYQLNMSIEQYLNLLVLFLVYGPLYWLIFSLLKRVNEVLYKKWFQPENSKGIE